MTTICVVQARMGSTRFPGKVLADLHGKPLLGFMLDRLTGLDVDHVVVATPDGPADDEVERVAAMHGAKVVRGPEDDVLGRFSLVLDQFPADSVVRLTADCPLIDPVVVQQAIDILEQQDFDLVSTGWIRTFPDGIDLEVISEPTLHAAIREARDSVERGHVTPFVYRHPERFSLGVVISGGAYGHLRWTVDAPADLERVQHMVAVSGGSLDWRSLLATDPDAGCPVGLWLRDITSHDLEEARSLIEVGLRPLTDWSPADDLEGLGDPARRLWFVQEDAKVVGLTRAEVSNGVAEVDVASVEGGPGLGAVLHELQARIGRQIGKLTTVAPDADGFPPEDLAAIGFTPAGGGRFSWTYSGT